jgi:hypothetical protein
MSARSMAMLVCALLVGCSTSRAEPTAAPRPLTKREVAARDEASTTSQRGSTQIRHELSTPVLGEREARMHHFTIPLPNAKLAFVDLKYQTPLVDALGDTALALQCNPRLVDAGQLVPKLEARRRTARTALCVTRDRSQLDAYLTETPITLPELAVFLLQQGCIEALNLDGGPSTAAVARLPRGVLTIARGEALPYGLGFTVR